MATDIAVLRAGKLALDEELESVKERFRWVDVTDAGLAEELTELAPVLTQARGRGSSILVQRFDDRAFQELCGRVGADRLQQRTPLLEEILILQTESSDGSSGRKTVESKPAVAGSTGVEG